MSKNTTNNHIHRVPQKEICLLASDYLAPSYSNCTNMLQVAAVIITVQNRQMLTTTLIAISWHWKMGTVTT